MQIMRRWTRVVLTGLSACIAGCAVVATPMRWHPVPDDAVVEVSITHAWLDPEQRAPFDEHVSRLRRLLDDQPGLVGHSVRRALGGAQVWTYTVWRNAQARRNFLRAGPHSAAVQQAASAIMDMRVFRTRLRFREVPRSWPQVLKLLPPG